MAVEPVTKNSKTGERLGHENIFRFEHTEANVLGGDISRVSKYSWKNVVLEVIGQSYMSLNRWELMP